MVTDCCAGIGLAVVGNEIEGDDPAFSRIESLIAG